MKVEGRMTVGLYREKVEGTVGEILKRCKHLCTIYPGVFRLCDECPILHI